MKDQKGNEYEFLSEDKTCVFFSLLEGYPNVWNM